MTTGNPFRDFALGELLETLLPDFILAFTFFTALTYAVLGRHFGQKRPAIAMSAALGLALSVGLAWWENESGWSIRSLGPIAVIIVLIMLGLVLHRAIRPEGGTWAGLSIAIGVSILVARVLDLEPPVSPEIVQTVVTVALVVGALAFLMHHRGPSLAPRLAASPRSELVNIRRDRREHVNDRRVGDWIRRGLRRTRRSLNQIVEHPEKRSDILLQIRRMLPAEGWLTERMARLRERAHQIRKGHVARLEETKMAFKGLPTAAKKKAAADLAARYQQLAGADKRLERLDLAVAETERRIKELTRRAQVAVAQYDHAGAHDLLKQAERLQKHNAKLFGAIDRMEQKLTEIAEEIARRAAASSAANTPDG